MSFFNLDSRDSSMVVLSFSIMLFMSFMSSSLSRVYDSDCVFISSHCDQWYKEWETQWESENSFINMYRNQTRHKSKMNHSNMQPDSEHVQKLHAHIQKLQAENMELRRQNNQLQYEKSFIESNLSYDSFLIYVLFDFCTCWLNCFQILIVFLILCIIGHIFGLPFFKSSLNVICGLRAHIVTAHSETKSRYDSYKISANEDRTFISERLSARNLELSEMEEAIKKYKHHWSHIWPPILQIFP
jgi:hypothetical protein